MAHKIVWSPQALEDIDSIADYIARDSEMYAVSVAQSLFEAPAKLLEFPLLGRVIPESQTESMREIFVHDYRVMYEIAGNEIHILTIVHGKRDFREDMIQPDDSANSR
ncbi:MAG: toxin ParE1/3/4 [Verrucomicrobiales bacterium]